LHKRRASYHCNISMKWNHWWWDPISVDRTVVCPFW